MSFLQFGGIYFVFTNDSMKTILQDKCIQLFIIWLKQNKWMRVHSEYAVAARSDIRCVYVHKLINENAHGRRSSSRIGRLNVAGPQPQFNRCKLLCTCTWSVIAWSILTGAGATPVQTILGKRCLTTEKWAMLLMCWCTRRLHEGKAQPCISSLQWSVYGWRPTTSLPRGDDLHRLALLGGKHPVRHHSP